MRVFGMPSSSVEPNFDWSLPGSLRYLVPPVAITLPSASSRFPEQNSDPSLVGSLVLKMLPGTSGAVCSLLGAPPSRGVGSASHALLGFLLVSCFGFMSRLWSLRPTTPYSDRIESSTFSVPARLSQYTTRPSASTVCEPAVGLQSMKPRVTPLPFEVAPPGGTVGFTSGVAVGDWSSPNGLPLLRSMQRAVVATRL
jgi:hypothetical protein